MTPNLSSILIAVVAFAVAFAIAKYFSIRRQRRKGHLQQVLQQQGQSRQVRRARERRVGR